MTRSILLSVSRTLKIGSELTIRKLSQMLAIALYFHVDAGSGMANAPVIKHLSVFLFGRKMDGLYILGRLETLSLKIGCRNSME